MGILEEFSIDVGQRLEVGTLDRSEFTGTVTGGTNTTVLVLAQDAGTEVAIPRHALAYVESTAPPSHPGLD